MKRVTVREARTNLSQLLADGEDGEDVIIMRGAEPAVRLILAGEPVPKRQFGALAGKVTVTPAFFEPSSDDERAAWEE